jgi:hypothetical protein
MSKFYMTLHTPPWGISGFKNQPKIAICDLDPKLCTPTQKKIVFARPGKNLKKLFWNLLKSKMPKKMYKIIFDKKYELPIGKP